MADVENITKLVENVTEAVNGTKTPATPEGSAVAYASLLIMALIPIVLGSFRSIKSAGGENSESMTGKDAAMFPLVASGFLFGIYIVFQIFSKEYINLLLTVYFFFLGVMALSHIAGPIVSKLLPASFPNAAYHLMLTQGDSNEESEELINYKFDRKEVVSLALCGLVGVWYLTKKHWIANNLFGMAFAISGVEFLQLNAVSTGCILLGGLFCYDVFWVFGTNVMVTVAKSFDAPIKLIFPQDLLEKGIAADNFAMLGLGDIVIPGIFIALLLRFDLSLGRNSKVYFYASFIAYIAGLVTTIVVMHVFKHAQPALLYLVPYCVGTPLLVALIKGDLGVMFKYQSDTKESKAAEAAEADKQVKKEK